MSYKDFDAIPVTTATMIAELEGEAYIEKIFPMLEFTELDVAEDFIAGDKLPGCDIPGAIIGGCYKNITRGIVKHKTQKKKTKNFRNSISMDICVNIKNVSRVSKINESNNVVTKNVNVKLSKERIHMTGLKSKEMAMETSNHVLDHIEKIQQQINYINENPDKNAITITWLKSHTKGEYYVIDNSNENILQLGADDVIEYVPFKDIYLVDPTEDEPDVISVVKNTSGEIKHKKIIKSFRQWSAGDYIDTDKRVKNANGITYKTIGNNDDDIVDCVYEENFFYYPQDYDNEGNITRYKFVNHNGSTLRIVTFEKLIVQEVHSIVIPKEFPDNYPENVDSRIATFYLKQAGNFRYYHNYCLHMDLLSKIKRVKSEKLSVKNIRVAMINKSFGLNFKINRWKLASNINGINNFTARYTNTSDHSVTVNLPYTLSDEMKKIRRKDKKPQHTFLIYKSGLVTQSGPNIDLMRSAYIEFMEAITQIKHLIMIPNSKFKLKFTPVSYRNAKKLHDKKKNNTVHEIKSESVNVPSNMLKNKPVLNIQLSKMFESDIEEQVPRVSKMVV